MTLLVFGKTGQVALSLQCLAPDAIFLDRVQADLMDPDACAAAIKRNAPDAVINAAAWTAVDSAEAEEAAAMIVNGDAPAAMARACTLLNIPLVHISTDYVFNGSGDAPFAPDHPTAPLSSYGRSKLKGEEGVRTAGGHHAILRTSWVFSADGTNFLKTMLRLSETRNALSIVADQIGGPTPAQAIARTTLVMAQALGRGRPSGTWHLSGYPDVSWADFAEWIFSCAGRDVAITRIPSAAYATAAARPLNSRLDCTSLARDFALGRPDWKAQVRADVKRLTT